jgi:hypothetical protein
MRVPLAMQEGEGRQSEVGDARGRRKSFSGVKAR